MNRSRSLPGLAWLLATLASPVFAQTTSPPAGTRVAPRDESPIAAAKALLATDGYIRPPDEIARLVTAPRHLNVALTQLSPDRRWFLREKHAGMPSVTSFGKFRHYFAGLQVDPKANRARVLTTRGASGLELIEATTSQARPIETPAGATISNPVWSPDGKQLAFIANLEAASYAFVADVATGKSRRVTRTPLLATLVTAVNWTADGKSLIAVLVPEGRSAEPKRPEIATGPLIRLWTDTLESSQRNYASLLQEPFDQELMQYYVTGQLALIDVRSRAVTKVGGPAMISGVDPSPDGRWLRITRLERPFSYVVQYGNFASVDEIWEPSGNVVAVVNRLPVREVTDTASRVARALRDSAKRSIAWLPDGGGIHYFENVPRRRADTSDTPSTGQGSGQSGRAERLVQWRAPFGPDDRKVLFQSEGPIGDVAFSPDGKTIFVARSRNNTGEILALPAGDTAAALRRTLARLRNWAPSFAVLGGRPQGFGGGRGGTPGDSLSFYLNPGSLALRPFAGTRVVILSGDTAAFLVGTRYSREWQTQGPREFLDRVSLANGSKTRIYESPADVSVDVTTLLDDEFTRGVITRQSATEHPNYQLVDFRSGAATPLTRNTDRAAEFTRLSRKRVWVTRADGVKFLVKLTLPADYQPGTRLPGMLWLYPYEYTSQADYDRSLRTEDINQYPASQPRTIEFLATQGYAVANFNPPIIGDQGRMNDSYIPDLRMNLLAVIDELERQGYVDRSRMAIGGHSYGAFSTVNAMVHTPFFKAGIAGDGMYNRTLTPTGFQSERRNLWSGQRTYLEMSPMLYAERLQGALLLYHMMEDQNVGTDPISSIRMMQALRAHGKVASLFLYPYEDHGPLTQETVLDLWGRWTAWLDIYVKNAGTKPPEKVTEN
ncbi:MAG TPA: prolyl oligopeptidase family serine peptidase [Gemmatimonadales bacterium]